MPATIKPLLLYGGVLGPNPGKVSFILHELAVPHTVVKVAFQDVKKPEYTAINPNGRLPAIHDPNTGLTLWESGAIIEYLIATYDTQHILSFPANSLEDWKCKQFLYFQVSGQGPYYGQGSFFVLQCEEKIPVAIDRYRKEIQRVTAVLEGLLEGKEWLVGGKCTYADLAFLTWQRVVVAYGIWPEWDMKAEAPRVVDWLERMEARPAVKEVMGEIGRLMAETKG